MKKTRIFHAVLFCLLLLTETLIALFVNDNFVRPYLGDVLVTLLICSFLRVFCPKGIPALPVYVFLFAAAVEVGQYFDLVALLGIQSRFLSVLLGRTFSVWDLLCYAIGCVLSFVLDRVSYRSKQPVPAKPSWEEIVESMQGKALPNVGCSVVRVILSKDRAKRILILKSDSGYFQIRYESLCAYDEEEWAYLFYISKGCYAYWNPVDSMLNTTSIYGTEEDAMQVVTSSLEYKKYFT